jgi:uncharacterized MAPEG superfamily protein
MQIAIVCLLIAGLLPYLTIAVAKAQPGFDNHSPRDWEARLDGYRRRAHAAHLNHFEQFPFFATAVIVAHLRLVDERLLATLAIAYVALRVAYTICYVVDWATLRSLAWVFALACPFTMYMQSI